VPSVLSPSDRLRLTLQVKEAIEGESFATANLTLATFGLGEVSWYDIEEHSWETLVLGSLRSASDDQLISIAAHFNFHPLQYLGPDEGAAAGAEVGPWRTDGVRVFLS
jgi:hypothetical protein